MLSLDTLSDDLKKQPYGLETELLRLNENHWLIKIMNFAHLQIDDQRALGFSIELRFSVDDQDHVTFNDNGNLLHLAAQATQLIYNLKLKLKKVQKINVIPIYRDGLVKYMNGNHSMFTYLKPINKKNKIIQTFNTQGYDNLKKGIAEYVVMALSIIHSAEITLHNLKLHAKD